MEVASRVTPVNSSKCHMRSHTACDSRRLCHSGYIRHARIIVRIFSRCHFPHRAVRFRSRRARTGIVGKGRVRGTPRGTGRSRGRPYNIIKARVKADRPRAERDGRGATDGRKEKETFFFYDRCESTFSGIHVANGTDVDVVRPLARNRFV